MSNFQRAVVVLSGSALILTLLFPWADYWVIGSDGGYVDVSSPSAIWTVEKEETTNWGFTAIQAAVVVIGAVIAVVLAGASGSEANAGERSDGPGDNPR